MTKEDFINNGIDYDSAMNLFMGKQDILERFLKKFLSDMSYEQLKAAIDNKDCEAAFKSAHTLKGVAGNLSMKTFAKTVSDMTEAFRSNDFEAGIVYVEQLDAQYKAMTDFISQL